MSYRLVIAEKPSVGAAYAKVLGATNRQDGYLEGNGYLVSWCVGHLVELAPPNVYDAKYVKWSIADLPILPQKWQYLVSASTKKQFGILQKLMHRPDVDSIVNSCDAGREGELIFRLVYQQTGCKKPVFRLWLSSMEESAIREGFAHLKPSTEYDALYNAALCRERAEWIVGINASRLFSCLYGRPLAVGRVMTPVLAMTVVREAEIAAFTPEKFRSGVRKRRNLDPHSLPDDDVRFIDPRYNELFRVPDGSMVQLKFPNGRQYSEKVEYLDDYHMRIGSAVQHICEFAERMARSHATVEPEPLTQQDYRVWNLEYDFYLTVQENNGLWEYALYQGDCSLLERGKLDAPELMIEEVRDEIVYTHNLGKNACISLSPEEFAQKLADREEIQSYRMKQFQQSGQDCYLLMQLKRDADPALRFASMRYLEKQNIAPSIENYEILYRGNLPTGKRSVPQPELLEQLYRKFNCAQPMDYHGHSLSVSDVILLNQAGKISAHYVDSIGFRELSGFQDKQERSSVLSQLKAKCDMPECNPTKCRKGRNDHAI